MLPYVFPAPSPSSSGASLDGEITSSVKYFDIEIPAQGDQFQVQAANLLTDALDVFALSVSTDGGTTFFTDVNQSDSYLFSGIKRSSAGGTGDIHGADGLMDISHQQDPASVIPARLSLLITPGTDSIMPTFQIRSVTNGDGGLWCCVADATVNPSAAVPFVLARINVVRVQLYGDGTNNPPASDNKITAGLWSLRQV